MLRVPAGSSATATPMKSLAGHLSRRLRFPPHDRCLLNLAQMHCRPLSSAQALHRAKRDASPPTVTSAPPPPAPAPSDRDSNLDPAAYDNFYSTTTKQTPHRVEPYSMSSAHPQARLSLRPAPGSFLKTTLIAPRPPRVPVPIAMLPTHSGSPSPSADSSLDRSAQHHYAAYDLPRGYPGDYMYTPPPPPSQYHPHPHVHPDEHHRYDDHAQYAPQPFPIAHGGYVPYRTILSGSMAPPQGSGGGAGVIQAVHTDDVPTKLSDRVRRRCFNCCTTDTTTNNHTKNEKQASGNTLLMTLSESLRLDKKICNNSRVSMEGHLEGIKLYLWLDFVAGALLGASWQDLDATHVINCLMGILRGCCATNEASSNARTRVQAPSSSRTSAARLRPRLSVGVHPPPPQAQLPFAIARLLSRPTRITLSSFFSSTTFSSRLRIAYISADPSLRSPTKPPPTTPGPVSYPTSASAPPPAHGAPSTPNPSAPANDFASVNGSANGQHNGSASHPGTPNPQSVNRSPKLPGVDSLRPPSRDERREREERDDRREPSLE
ncbi:hypothetical protein FB451DRAFT_1179198 [Mycena latifolia]|nr:hypothetical protein FB451DRAFT_1179198 [Mycena latifolia]